MQARAVTHGLPLDSVGGSTLRNIPENKQTQISNSWVGNGFHIPSGPGLVGPGRASSLPTVQCVSEQHLDAHSWVSFRQVLVDVSGKLTHDQFAREISSLFADFPGNDKASWHKSHKCLRGCDWDVLFTYRAFLIPCGLDEFSQGPPWTGQRNRPLLQAAIAVQRARRFQLRPRSLAPARTHEGGPHISGRASSVSVRVGHPGGC